MFDHPKAASRRLRYFLPVAIFDSTNSNFRTPAALTEGLEKP